MDAMMLPSPAGREASWGGSAPPYVRHREERTLLYQLVEENYPAFKAHLAVQGMHLPWYVGQEFEDYLKCGRLEDGSHEVHPCAASLQGSLRLCKSAILPICLWVRCDQCPRCHLLARFAAR